MNTVLIKKIAIPLLVLVILGFGLTWLAYNLPDFLVDDLFNLVVNRSQADNTFEDDGLYVITTGTGAPLPDQGRAGPQTVIVAGDQILVFDAGPGSTLNIELTPVDVGAIDALFLTHYHSDHIGDIGELMLKRWATSGQAQPLPIYGPPGVAKIVGGFEAAYLLDKQYRIDHHGEDAVPASGFGAEVHLFDLGTDLMSSEVIYQQGDVQVIAFNVDHAPIYPAVGYRINYKDRSVVITGDTVYTESLTHHTMGADLLVSEALHHEFSQMLSDATNEIENNASTVAEDIQDYHITPEQVGMVARDAGITQVLVTHILPPIPSEILVNPFLRTTRAVFDGKVTMANDGTMIKLPVNSDEITIEELLK
jgi:ribonuclease Z